MSNSKMKRNKSGVRFATSTSVLGPKTPNEENLPAISHKYVPDLHRETTMKSPDTKLSEAMADTLSLLEKYPKFQCLFTEPDPDVSEGLDLFLKDMYTNSKKNKYYLDVRKYVIIKQIANWKQTDENAINVLVFFRATPFKSNQVPPCGVTFAFPKKSTDPLEQFQCLKSEDGRYLSPIKCYSALYEVLSSAIAKSEDFQTEILSFQDTPEQMEITASLPSGLKYNLIPCIQTSEEDPYYVAKPYVNDDNPESDSVWRKCFAEKEDYILNTVFSTDKGIRQKAVVLLIAMCTGDWRLRTLNPYHIKTILMLEIDFEIDNSPRWQRLGLETYLVSLVKRLNTTVAAKNLPHFFMNDVNLLSKLTDRQLKTLKSVLENISDNEEALCRLLRNLRHQLPDVQREQ